MKTKSVLAAQDFGFREDVHNEESQSCLSYMWHPYWSLFMPLPNIIKIFQTFKKLWSTQESGVEIHSGEITRKKEQSNCPSCMWHSYLTWCMSLPNMMNFFSQTIWELWPAQDFCFRGEKYIRKKVSCLSCTWHLSWSLCMSLLNIIKLRIYGVHKNLA